MTTQTKTATPLSFKMITDFILVSSGIFIGLLIILSGFMLWVDYQTNPANNLLVTASSQIVAAIPGSLNEFLYSQAATMGLPLTVETKAYWYMARSSGIMAYLLLWFATVWGILMSTKLTGKLIAPPVTYGLHEFFPILATTMATFHAVILLGDSYIGFNIFHLLIPFTSPYQPFWTGLGVISLELCIVLIISLFVRKQIGYKTWRIFHYLAYIAFVMALFHGSMAGSDSQFTLMKLTYLMTGLSVLFLTYYRVFTLKLGGRN